jgi:hypothetical protein
VFNIVKVDPCDVASPSGSISPELDINEGILRGTTGDVSLNVDYLSSDGVEKWVKLPAYKAAVHPNLWKLAILHAVFPTYNGPSDTVGWRRKNV